MLVGQPDALLSSRALPPIYRALVASPGRFFDPRLGEWTFDSTTLINAHKAGNFLLRLIGGFTGRARLVEDVLNEVQGLAGGTIRLSKWYREEKLVLGEDLAFYKKVRSAWASGPGKDRGEAACIALAKRNSWTMVTDDGVAFETATAEGVRCTRTTNLLVCSVRAGWWSVDDAWNSFQALLSATGGKPRLGPMPWGDEGGFRALCAMNHFDT